MICFVFLQEEEALMATDEIRRQLDLLMGADRNGDVAVKKNFTDSDVCKFYLCGLCPHELFNNTVCANNT